MTTQARRYKNANAGKRRVHNAAFKAIALGAIISKIRVEIELGYAGSEMMACLWHAVEQDAEDYDDALKAIECIVGELAKRRNRLLHARDLLR